MDLSVLLTTPHELRADARRLDAAAERVEAVRERLRRRHAALQWTGRDAREVAEHERALFAHLAQMAADLRHEAVALRRLAGDIEHAVGAFRAAARRVAGWFEGVFSRALHHPVSFVKEVGSTIVGVGSSLVHGLLSIVPGVDAPDGSDLVQAMRGSWRWHDRNLPADTLDARYADVISYARAKGYSG